MRPGQPLLFENPLHTPQYFSLLSIPFDTLELENDVIWSASAVPLHCPNLHKLLSSKLQRVLMMVIAAPRFCRASTLPLQLYNPLELLAKAGSTPLERAHKLVAATQRSHRSFANFRLARHNPHELLTRAGASHDCGYANGCSHTTVPLTVCVIQIGITNLPLESEWPGIHRCKIEGFACAAFDRADPDRAGSDRAGFDGAVFLHPRITYLRQDLYRLEHEGWARSCCWMQKDGRKPRKFSASILEERSQLSDVW